MSASAKAVTVEMPRASAPERSDASKIQFREHMRALAVAFLNQHLQSFSDSAEQLLFELAGNTNDEELHTLYLDTVSRLRNNRELLKKGPAENYLRQLDSEVQLAAVVVDDQTDTEDVIAIKNLLNQTCSRYTNQMMALDDIFEQIGGDTALNPMAPMRFCIAWKDAVDTLKVSADARFIIYKLFCKLVVNRLGTLYERALGELGMQGIKPRVRISAAPLAATKEPPRARVAPLPVSADAGSATTDITHKSIAAQIKNRRVPDVVRDFLDSTWRDVLNRIQKDEGVGSASWVVALKTVDELVGIVQPLDNVLHHQKVLDTIPALLCKLQSGIATVNADRKLKDQLFNLLISTHARSIQYKKTAQASNKPGKK